MRALWTARALFMTGHRRAMNCRLVMVPPPGEWWVAVDKERRVDGEVFFKKGHMALEWDNKASIVASCCGGVWYGRGEMEEKRK